jgi:hypothetical protein
MVGMAAMFMVLFSFFIFQNGKNFNKVPLNFTSPADRAAGWIEGKSGPTDFPFQPPGKKIC